MKKITILSVLALVFTSGLDGIDVLRSKIEMGVEAISYAERLTTSSSHLGYYFRDDSWETGTHLLYSIKPSKGWAFARDAKGETMFRTLVNAFRTSGGAGDTFTKLFQERGGNIGLVYNSEGLLIRIWTPEGHEDLASEGLFGMLDTWFSWNPTEAEIATQLQNAKDLFGAKYGEPLGTFFNNIRFLTPRELLDPLTGYKDDIMSVTVQDVMDFKNYMQSEAGRAMSYSGCISRKMDQEQFARIFETLINNYRLDSEAQKAKPYFGQKYPYLVDRYQAEEGVKIHGHLLQNFNVIRPESFLLSQLWVKSIAPAVNQVGVPEDWQNEYQAYSTRGTVNGIMQFSSDKLGEAQAKQKLLQIHVATWNLMIDRVKGEKLVATDQEREELLAEMMKEVGSNRGNFRYFFERAALGRVELSHDYIQLITGSFTDAEKQMLAKYVGALKQGLGTQICLCLAKNAPE